MQKEVGLVKIADRITNLQTPPKHWSKDKVAKYCIEAKLISRSLHNKNTYLNACLEEKIKAYENML